MGKREERWNEMKQDYRNREMPKEQLDKMKSAIERAKKEKRRAPRAFAAAAAAAAIVLAVLPNASGDIAHAMHRIPILSKWVEVVTFRDYLYESERNMADIKVPEIAPQIPTEELGSTESEHAKAQENIKKSAEEINTEIKAITDGIIAEFKEFASNQEGYQDVIVDSEVIATTQSYFTLKLICYQGAGSGAEWHYFYTIDLETGKRLQLKDLFTEGSDYITPISESIKQQMKEQMKKDENVCYWLDNADIPEWNFEAITDETQFYLDENGDIVISFNEGDVAPMYMGCVEFTVPKDALSAIRK